DEEVIRLLAIDPHSPNEFRCNQLVRNLDEFYATFDLSQSAALWRDPSERATIWQLALTPNCDASGRTWTVPRVTGVRRRPTPSPSLLSLWVSWLFVGRMSRRVSTSCARG